MTARTKNQLGWLLLGVVGLLLGLVVSGNEGDLAMVVGSILTLLGAGAVLVGGGNLILDLINAKDDDSPK